MVAGGPVAGPFDRSSACLPARQRVSVSAMPVARAMHDMSPVCVRVRAHVHVRTRACVCAYTCGSICLWITFIHRVNVCVYTCVYTNRCTHVYAHVCIHVA